MIHLTHLWNYNETDQQVDVPFVGKMKSHPLKNVIFIRWIYYWIAVCLSTEVLTNFIIFWKYRTLDINLTVWIDDIDTTYMLHKLNTRIIFKSMTATTTVAANISSSASNWICFSSNSSLIFLFSSMFSKMISFWLCVLFSSSRSLLSSWSHLFSVKILFKVFKKCFTERP